MFVEEMGTNVSLSPLYAWSRRGRRAFGSAPRNWGKNVTLLASITRRGLGPCLAVEGSTTREVFEAYLERVLAPTLEPGQILVMDNLSAHKGGRVKEIVEGRGCELLCSCHPTRRTSIRLSRPSRRSRGSCAKPYGSHPRSADRGDGSSALSGVDEGCSGVLRTLRLPFDGSTAMTYALGAAEQRGVKGVGR